MPRCKLFSILPLLLATTASVFGQQDTGTLLGTVVDPARSVVGSAVVTLTNAATGATLSGTTNRNGVFQFTGVLVGTYSVRVASKGFKTFSMNDVLLQSAEVRNLGTLQMEIGEVTERIEVTAS